MPDAAYGTSQLRRKRRSPKELEAVQHALFSYAQEHKPVTVRQLFYAASVQGFVPKTEEGYDLVCRETVKMRRAKMMPYHWLADATRWMRRPQTFTGLEAALNETARTYRRSLWADAPVNVEIWLEKEALAGVVYDVTDEYDVPLMVVRGFSSLSYLHTAGEAIQASGKPTHIYYLGDHDPSGKVIPQKVDEGLREFAPDAQIDFSCVAVTEDQIAAWRLPSRPTKQSDSRAKNFKGDSVELDAIPPEQLRGIVRECIEQHLDPRRLAKLEWIEADERNTLHTIVTALRNGKLSLGTEAA